MSYLIQMTETIKVDDRWFVLRQQWLATEEQYQVIDCDNCDKKTTNVREKFHLVTIKDVEYLIPDITCVKVHNRIPSEYANINKYLSDKIQDQTGDHVKTMEEAFDVDLTKNFKPQYQDLEYEATVHLTNPSEIEENTYVVPEPEELDSNDDLVE